MDPEGVLVTDIAKEMLMNNLMQYVDDLNSPLDL